VKTKTVTIKINGAPFQVPENVTILKAAELACVKVPRLCLHPDLPAWGACGMCVVKMEGSPKMVRACTTPVAEGQSIITHDPEIVEVRRTVLEMILSTHPNDCLKCPRNRNCELQTLAAEFGIREVPFDQRLLDIPVDDSSPSIVLNPAKCIRCGRCVLVCQQMQNVWAVEFLGRGETTRIAPAGDLPLADSPCIKCGQCSAHCPVGAIYERDETRKVWEALRDPKKHCVVQIAPAVRVALGEPFGLEPGTVVTGKAYAALRRLGFSAVFDTNFGADLTIMEEASEFVRRFAEGKGEIPLVTSCCPAWVDYMEKFWPEMIPNFSSAKSPHEMVGVLTKTFYARKMKVDPASIFMVSVMPCTSKKHEITRSDDMFASGHQDIDVSLTTRELARMIQQAGIDFARLPDAEPDAPLGVYTGAATIFGATGGVMEAALRTAYHLVTGKELRDVNFTDVRGLEGVKEARLAIDGKEIRIAVAHWMCNIDTVLERVKTAREKGEQPPYHFIEVMACRGGCVGGGGQPYGATDEIRRKRAAGLYTDDLESKYRCSHQNPLIKQLYAEYLGQPLGERAHKLLHNRYRARPVYSR
jgi:NADP-reducing hydrogenase subunit HndD